MLIEILNTIEFHQHASQRIRWEDFAGDLIPFLACSDIAVFKALFNRTKDWADLEEMKRAGTPELGRVIAVLVEYLGVDDDRIRKLDALRDLEQS